MTLVPKQCYAHLFFWGTPLFADMVKLVSALVVLGVWFAFLFKRARPETFFRGLTRFLERRRQRRGKATPTTGAASFQA